MYTRRTVAGLAAAYARKEDGRMKGRRVVMVCLCCAVLGAVWGAGMAFGAGAAPAAGVASDYNDQWPAWRGPEANGVARNADPPVKWDEKTNVKWKVEIPGSGHASPIVWKDRVFVLTSIPSGEKAGSGDQKPAAAAIPGIPMKNPGGVQKFEVLCLDRKDHSTVWRRTVAEKAPHAATHADGSWASGSPVTDGERLYAFFGSNGLYCLDMNGNPLWDKDLGKMKVRMNFGEGSSPVLCGDRLIVNWDHEAGSFIVAFDKKTGDQLWKIPREEATSWATPLVVVVGGRRQMGTKATKSILHYNQVTWDVVVGGKPQVITSATKRIRSYDVATGALVWECGGMTENVIPSPVAAGGMAYMMSGYRGNALVCVDLSKAKGDITNSPAVLWKYDRDTSYAPSPLLYDGALYFLKSNAEELSCLEAKTGKVHFSAQKIEGLKGVYSSPVGAKGRVYITGRNGVTVVIQLGPEYKVLATNALDDSFTASAALVGKEMFLRGFKALYCITEK